MVVPAGSVQARMIWGAAIAAMISFISPGSTENAAKSCETGLPVTILPQPFTGNPTSQARSVNLVSAPH
jgi:hypothetical protein